MFTEQSGNNLACYVCGRARQHHGDEGGLSLKGAQVCMPPCLSLPIAFSFPLSFCLRGLAFPNCPVKGSCTKLNPSITCSFAVMESAGAKQCCGIVTLKH